MNATPPRLAEIANLAAQCALDAVFPPRCAGCGIWHKGLFCPTCAILLQRIETPMCAICGEPFDPLAKAARECARCRANRYHVAPPFDAARSVYQFAGPIREAIHRFKYEDKISLAAPLAGVLDDFLEHQPDAAARIPIERLSLIVPVPLHPWRQYRRGYNQSALLARELGKLRDVPHAALLRRNRYTTPQVELSTGERAANVKDAFAVDENMIKTLPAPGQAVLLMDDVHTTGATLAECAGVLKRAGVGEVYALTLAR